MKFDCITEEDFSNPDFKEDSVRELIIAPLLAELGFSHSGTMRVIRSKTLENPFIRVGTRNHPVKTIPDYTLIFEDKPILVIDAKAPSESIHNDAHVQQAYSYAIHPELRCQEFAICNGRAIAFYSIQQREPLATLYYGEFREKWDVLKKHLHPNYILEPIKRDFAPDFGLALHRLGMENAIDLYMIGVRLNLYGRVNDQLFTATANLDHVGTPHTVSFDFDQEMLPKVLSSLPVELARQFEWALSNAPFQASAGMAIELDLRCRLGVVIEKPGESFAPLIVDEILDSRFVPDPGIPTPKDIPPHIFQLRHAYKVGVKD